MNIYRREKELHSSSPASLPILVMAWISSWAWLVFITPLLLISLFFPNGRLLSSRWRGAVYLAIGQCLFTLIWTASTPTVNP